MQLKKDNEVMAPIQLDQVVVPCIRILAAKPTVFPVYCRGISQSLQLRVPRSALFPVNCHVTNITIQRSELCDRTTNITAQTNSDGTYKKHFRKFQRGLNTSGVFALLFSLLFLMFLLFKNNFNAVQLRLVLSFSACVGQHVQIVTHFFGLSRLNLYIVPI